MSLSISPEQDWAARWPGAPGYYAIGSNPKDARECEKEGATIEVVDRSVAVSGHREFLDWKRNKQEAE